MMLAPDPAWQSNSLADLAATIRAEHQAVLASHKMGAAHAMSAGDKLIVAKAKVKAAGGKWRDWVKENFEPHGLSYRTCRLYMQLARHRPEIEAEMAEVCHLSVNAALAAIAPAEPDDDAGDDDGGDDTGDDDGSTLSAEQRDQITALAQNYKWGAAQIAQALKLPLDDVRRFLEGDAGDAKAKPNLRVRPRGEDSDEWFTPPNVLAVARDVLGQFDLDPASCPEAQRNVQAVRYFSIADDGLAQEWKGRVWMNPPWSHPALDRFVSKLVDEYQVGNVTEAICLLNNVTDSAWFHEATDACSAFCLWRGRIKFEHLKGQQQASLYGSAFFYFGDHVEKFARRFSEFGQVVRPNREPKPKPEPKPAPEPARVDVQLAGEPFYDILQGDVRELIADLPEIHCVITSPPYFNLITYGDSDRQIGHEPTVEEYIATLVSVFTSIPLHPLGSIFVNLGDTRRDRALLNVPGRFCTAMQAAGFQLIDAVIWAKSVAKADGETIGRVLPEPCAGRLNSTAYEPFFRFVRTGADAWTDTVAVQVARNNVEPQPYLPEDLMRTTTSLNGRNLPNVWLINRRNSFVHTKEHYGCFPPELVERPIAGFCPPFVNPDGSLSRRIVEQVEYDDGIGPRTFGKSEPAAGISGRHDVGVRYTPRRPAHMGWEQVAADATPGIVCDPFAGTATVGEVALKMGRSFVGIDLYEEYVTIARRRCAEAKDFVRQNYGYTAVYERILNPPAPTPQPQDDGVDDSNVIRLDELARKIARVWDDPEVKDAPAVVRYRQGLLIERALLRRGRG